MARNSVEQFSLKDKAEFYSVVANTVEDLEQRRQWTMEQRVTPETGEVVTDIDGNTVYDMPNNEYDLRRYNAITRLIGILEEL